MIFLKVFRLIESSQQYYMMHLESIVTLLTQMCVKEAFSLQVMFNIKYKQKLHINKNELFTEILLISNG